MKVTMLFHIPDPERAMGGIAVHVLKLAEWLVRSEGIHVTIVSFGRENAKKIINGVTFVTLRTTWLDRILLPIPLLRLAYTIRVVSPDVVHLQGTATNPYLLSVLFFHGKKDHAMITVHGHSAEEAGTSGALLKRTLMKRVMSWGEKAAVSSLGRVVCVTSRMRNELIAKYGSEIEAKIIVLPNGVDSVEYSDSMLDRNAEFPNLPRTDGLTILTAKALLPHNGQEYLIRALQVVLDKVPGARLLLAGEGVDRKRLERLAQMLSIEDSVFFLGNVPHRNIPQLIAIADIVVLPSLSIGGVEEGSSLFLLEAMAAGKPVIASKVGGNAETIVHNTTGILVDDRDCVALADSIASLWLHPGRAAEIGNNAKQFILDERQWSQIASEYARIYRELSQSQL